MAAFVAAIFLRALAGWVVPSPLFIVLIEWFDQAPVARATVTGGFLSSGKLGDT